MRPAHLRRRTLKLTCGATIRCMADEGPAPLSRGRGFGCGGGGGGLIGRRGGSRHGRCTRRGARVRARRPRGGCCRVHLDGGRLVGMCLPDGARLMLAAQPHKVLLPRFPCARTLERQLPSKGAVARKTAP
eukprot:scaffold302423_cov39-Tisochrysis_lutea.AAC.3